MAGSIARVTVLDRLFRSRSRPKTIQVDNGSEFTSKAMNQWAYFNQVTLDFSRLGKSTDRSMYYRLRGTNHPRSTPFETDAAGNPLVDSLATENLGLDGAAEAWADLWFYSNPIFVYLSRKSSAR
jgi:transposase InsO family protein